MIDLERIKVLATARWDMKYMFWIKAWHKLSLLCVVQGNKHYWDRTHRRDARGSCSGWGTSYYGAMYEHVVVHAKTDRSWVDADKIWNWFKPNESKEEHAKKLQDLEVLKKAMLVKRDMKKKLSEDLLLPSPPRVPVPIPGDAYAPVSWIIT